MNNHHAGAAGVTDSVAPAGGVQPTAHCPRHAIYERACLTCQNYAREQIAFARAARSESGDAFGTHPDSEIREIGTRPGVGGGTRPDLESTWSEPLSPESERKARPVSHGGDSGRTGTHLGTHPDGDSGPSYFDVAALLAGGLPDPEAPTVCLRSDGVGLFYPEQYNVLFGDPEHGKTLLGDHATVCELDEGGRVLRLDLDHNGARPSIKRLLTMGGKPSVLGDRDRFLYIAPDDRRDVLAVVEHMKQWKPTLVVLDSLGELLPMFGHNSNNGDDFTVCHSAVIKPLFRTGACVIGIDHLAKGTDSRAYGAGGTIAKKRAIGGTSIRVTVDSPFTPGKGGSAYLTINKDRHGGLRQRCPTRDKEPLAGKFVLWPNDDGTVRAEIKAPKADEHNPAEAAPPEDIAAIAALDPQPASANDAQARLKWRATRARTAYKAWKLGGPA